MCNVAAVALIGGGQLLNTLGQNRGLRAQQRTQAIALDRIRHADEAVRQRAVEASKRLTLQFAEQGQVDISGTTDAMADLGVTPESGGAALTLARAQQAGARPAAGRRRLAQARELSDARSDRAGIRRDLQLSLSSLPEELRAAGMKGGGLRAAGHGLTSLGMMASLHSAPGAATGTAGQQAALTLGQATPAQRAFDQPFDLAAAGPAGARFSLRREDDAR